MTRRVILAGAIFAMLTLIAVCAFVLSFTALTDLAARHGVSAHQAWMIPIVVDTSIIAATLAVVTLTERRWYAWSLLTLAAGLSVAGNVAHAWQLGVVAVVIAAVPPVFLLAMTELAVALTRPVRGPSFDPVVIAPLFPRNAEATETIDLAQRWRQSRTAV